MAELQRVKDKTGRVWNRYEKRFRLANPCDVDLAAAGVTAWARTDFKVAPDGDGSDQLAVQAWDHDPSLQTEIHNRIVFRRHPGAAAVEALSRRSREELLFKLDDLVVVGPEHEQASAEQLAEQLALLTSEEKAVMCVHSIVYAAPADEISELVQGDPESLGKRVRSTEGRPALLPVEEHHVALRSFVAALVEAGLTHVVYGTPTDQEVVLPLAGNLRHQLRCALQDLAPDEVRASLVKTLPAVERQALAAIAELTGRPLGPVGGFNPSSYGVTVERSRVVELGLHDSDLAELPPVIGYFTELTQLMLSGNRLATLPPELGRLANLRYVDASNNALVELPPELGAWKAVETLDLDDNHLAALPEELRHMTALRHLYLANNRFKSVPKCVFQLPRLKELRLQGNPLRKLPRELADALKLKTLALDSKLERDQVAKKLAAKGVRLEFY